MFNANNFIIYDANESDLVKSRRRPVAMGNDGQEQLTKNSQWHE